MKVIILAGGDGTRLWPISRAAFPKQFLQLGGKYSFLQKILLMFLKKWKAEDILLVTRQEYFHLIKEHIHSLDPQLEHQIILEPEKKGTGPAIALAVKYLQEKGVKPSEGILVTSSDYSISTEERFLEILELAEPVIGSGKIVTFGVPPTWPETGYGYIKCKNKENCLFADVEEFIEKPSFKVAKEYVESGNYLWNCGIFGFQIELFLNEIKMHADEIFRCAEGNYQTVIENFSKMPTISIDYALMEKSKNIVAIPMDLTWSDIGCWDSIFDLLSKDLSQNVKIGNIVDIDTENSLIIGGKRLISTIGLRDMLIIDTEDALLLGRKGESQRVKELVEELRMKGKKETLEHVITHRPWGYYTVLEESSEYKVKKIVVNSKQKLSLQLHHHRSEHWIIVNGIAKVTHGKNQHILQSNESIFIPQRTPHRLENTREEILEIIEIQLGHYLGEDDIVRLEDIYGRPVSEEAYLEAEKSPQLVNV